MYSQVVHIAWYVFVVAISAVFAELARGYTAYKEGDNTPKNVGRLNFNFLKHIDIVGSILLPLTLLVAKSGFAIGWAKHIPYNDHNFTDKKKSLFKIAVAGVLVHICLGVLATIFLRIIVSGGVYTGNLVEALTSVAIANYLLAFFNLLPIPPLDGEKIFFAWIPSNYGHARKVLEYYSVPLIVIAIVLLWPYMFSSIDFLFKLITGVNLTPIS